MRFDWKPFVWRLTINSTANTKHLTGKPLLVLKTAHVLNRRIRECQIERPIRQSSTASVTENITEIRGQTLRRTFQIQEARAPGEIGDAAPHIHPSAKVNHARAVTKLFCQPAQASAPKVSSDDAINLVNDAHRLLSSPL